MDPDVAEVVTSLAPVLDAFAAHAGIVFPRGVTGQVFLRELLDGGPGTPADQAFFARLGVSLIHPALQEDQANLKEIGDLIRSRLAARGTA